MNSETFWIAVGSLFAGAALAWAIFSFYVARNDQDHRDQANLFYTNFYNWQKWVNDTLKEVEVSLAVAVERLNTLAPKPQRARKK